MAALACKTTAMDSDGDGIREAADVGLRLLEQYGDEWWEAQVIRRVNTGMDIDFTKKSRGRTWKTFIEWSKLAEGAEISPQPIKHTGGCP